MENPNEEEELSVGVFELPGEPAIVINGVPPLIPRDGTLVLSPIASDTESQRSFGFGEWLEGRDVRKLFGDQFYNGKVTEFDKETGWYKVMYEDGDFEDLEWHELEELLLPLDITVPLKTLALKIIKKKQKPSFKSGKNAGRARNGRTKSAMGKVKTSEVLEEGSSMKFNTPVDRRQVAKVQQVKTDEHN